jgi:outer membrane murein-binding lipoprotein Lpp
MFRRRRPLMRAAVVGGAAYSVGKHNQANRDAAAGQDADQDARIDQLEAQQAPQAAAPAPSGALDDAAIEQLQKLSELQKAGVLTQEEFDDQKRKLLGG